ncbi:hypothetical protein GCM10027598_58240 [Amycolatopsis oliviviridis]|uniref:Secreted protein n=1 Tax=Amycolatopsis oliviviridis TaxID=1471590 RepID=A0ABQ3LX10_9PSEU|nr:hypothetical protein GCM10017790_58890 [Amycolatopsis oliviviridis]
MFVVSLAWTATTVGEYCSDGAVPHATGCVLTRVAATTPMTISSRRERRIAMVTDMVNLAFESEPRCGRFVCAGSRMPSGGPVSPVTDGDRMGKG